MRLLTLTVAGTALVGAGLAAPAAGDQRDPEDVIGFSPPVVRPGERVAFTVAGCEDGELESIAFAGRVAVVDGGGRVALKPNLGGGTYAVVADCGKHSVTGGLRVSGARSWPSLLPGALNPQMARATHG